MKLKLLALVLITFSITACDRVGSDSWCEKLKEKPKSQWTMEEAGDYTKYCVLGVDPNNWCEKMEKKDKVDWTASEAADYAKNCVGRSD
ncbi:MAG: DUF3012 domain-containing protein [Xanthomonadales bacterium]|jgi:hypothetical protein|nr:DUF3012 domain-containing protein [Xanthomonadales bacterium]